MINKENLKTFQPVKLSNMTIKNAIARSATHSMLGNLDGTISVEELDMFEELAKNEVGLIIAGQFFINKDGIVAPGSNELSNDKQVAAAAKIMDRTEPYRTKVIAQINHAGAKAMPEDRFAASPIELEPGKKAREITLSEIKQVRQDFIDAALRAKEAGFDGVQVHCAHDYLLCQFLTPSFNKRTDTYGVDAQGRFRLTKEIISGIKEKCGQDFPVFIKINSTADEENTQYQSDLKQMMVWLEDLGVEAVEFSGTGYKFKKYQDHNYFLEDALNIKNDTNIPIILVGGIRNIDDMEAVLTTGVSMVSLSRPLISEPDLITRLLNGQEKARCVSCMKCGLAGRKRCILNK